MAGASDLPRHGFLFAYVSADGKEHVRVNEVLEAHRGQRSTPGMQETSWNEIEAARFSYAVADQRVYRTRCYDPKLGSFISEHRIAFDGGDNFYAYVTNSPTNSGDPPASVVSAAAESLERREASGRGACDGL